MTAALTFLAACAGGDGVGDRPPTPSTSTGSPVATTAAPTALSTTPGTAPPTSSVLPSAGPVTFRARGFTLPAGAGLRVVVRAALPRVTVRRTGAGGPLSVCPVADAMAAVAPATCSDLGVERVVELGAATGVEVRAGGVAASVDEVTVTYLPTDRAMILVTPARSPGSCPATACDAAFSLGSPRAGPFTLDAPGSEGRRRLVLQAVSVVGGNPRALATVEGGGALSIRATLEASAEAVVLSHELLDGAVGALAMKISWP